MHVMYTNQSLSIMNNLIKYVIGMVMIPTALIILCSGINYLISLVFCVTYTDIQQSPIWVPWGLIILIAIIVYLTSVNFDND